MSERILAGSTSWDFYDSNKNLVFSAKSLTDSGINASASEDTVRGGDNNSRLGSYFFDSNLAMTLTSPVFSMEYLAVKFSSDITMSSDIQKVETITTSVINQITVSDTPVAFPGTSTIVGAYKLANSNTWTKITFTGKVATVSGLAIGSVVCVKYFYTDASAKEMVIPSSMIPKVLYGVGTINEFKSGTDNVVSTTSSIVGKLQVVVPQFQFDPNADISLTSSGHADIPLSGNALINFDGGCGNSGYYAILSETTIGGDPFTNCIAIGVKDGDVDLAISKTETLQVYGFYNDGTAPSLLDNSLLTFTSGTTATATVGAHTGLVTAVANGSSVISITISTKTSISTTAVVTVA